jgi:uncharacterized membrane protein
VLKDINCESFVRSRRVGIKMEKYRKNVSEVIRSVGTVIKNNIIYLLVVIFSISFIYAGYHICKFENDAESVRDLVVAKVVEIEYSPFRDADASNLIHFSAKITKGERKGEIVKATQAVSLEKDKSNLYEEYAIGVELGDNVTLEYVEYSPAGEPGWVFYQHTRVDVLIILCIIFLFIILIIGKKKGVTTIISLTFTCSVIFFVYIPSIIKGYNIYLSTIIISVFIIVMTLLMIDGANKKTLCAILGNIGGVAMAAILAVIAGIFLTLTGIANEDLLKLASMEKSYLWNLEAIIWGGVVIGALGAIMDTAMTIASAMNELSEHMEDKTFSKMLKSGMNIGRDAIGTMTNTLILAYIGGSLAFVLLLTAVNSGNGIEFLFSTEMIAVEIMQAIIGSIGILFAVPITALFAAYIFNKSSGKNSEQSTEQATEQESKVQGPEQTNTT